MKTTTTYTFFTLIWVTLLCSSLSSARAQTVEWIRQLGSPGTDVSYGVATDALGNVYISGTTGGDLDGPGPGTLAGSTAAFLVKYDSAGTLKWTKQLDSTSASYGVATDALGNIYISGSAWGDIDGPGPGTLPGSTDAFLTKYDSAGNLAWTKQLGSTNWDQSRSVTTDALGNVYISGSTRGDIDGPGPGTNAGGFQDAFVAKYDSAGTLKWTKQLDSTSASYGVATDNSGNVYISGWTEYNTDYSDAFVTKYDSAGDLKWTRQLGTADLDTSWGVTTDNFGNIYISGYTWGDFDGPGPGSNAGSFDAFLTKYDSAGNLAWTKQLGTIGDDISYGVTTDNFGNIYISGYTDGDLDGPGPGVHAGGLDAFVAKYDSAGNLAWTKQLGTIHEDWSHDVTIDNLGNIYLSGLTHGDLAGPNAGRNDAFLIKIHDDSFVVVPEPNALVLMLLAVASLYVCNRHTRSQAALQRKA